MSKWPMYRDMTDEQPQPVARVMVHRTGGNAGIAWSAVAVTPGDSLPLMPDGTMLYASPPPPAATEPSDAEVEAACAVYDALGPTTDRGLMADALRAAAAARGK